MKQGDITKAHCNTCAGERNHIVVNAHRVEVDDETLGEHGFDSYDLLKCAGCERITFRHTHESSYEPDEKGEIVPTVSYYPPAMFRRRPKWLLALRLRSSHSFIPPLLDEIYTALHNDCLSIAAMGVRALLERVMIDRVGDHQSFIANLSEFQKQGFIGARQREALDATLDFGHAAIHRNYAPSKHDLRHALDITEHIIEGVYASDARAAALKKNTPPRKTK